MRLQRRSGHIPGRSQSKTQKNRAMCNVNTNKERNFCRFENDTETIVVFRNESDGRVEISDSIDLAPDNGKFELQFIGVSETADLGGIETSGRNVLF
jgi:hypothetical protein